MKKIVITSTFTSTVEIAWCDTAPPKPARVSLARVVQLEIDSMATFRHTFSLSPVTVSDVQTRKVSIKVGNEDPIVQSLAGVALVSDPIDLDLGSVVTVTFQDIDTSGNASPISDPFTFTVVDTVPPPQPGAVGIATIQQIG